MKIKIFFLILAAAWVPAGRAQQAQVSLPQTPAGRQVEAYVLV